MNIMTSDQHSNPSTNSNTTSSTFSELILDVETTHNNESEIKDHDNFHMDNFNSTSNINVTPKVEVDEFSPFQPNNFFGSLDLLESSLSSICKSKGFKLKRVRSEQVRRTLKCNCNQCPVFFNLNLTLNGAHCTKKILTHNHDLNRHSQRNIPKTDPSKQLFNSSVNSLWKTCLDLLNQDNNIHYRTHVELFLKTTIHAMSSPGPLVPYKKEVNNLPPRHHPILIFPPPPDVLTEHDNNNIEAFKSLLDANLSLQTSYIDMSSGTTTSYPSLLQKRTLPEDTSNNESFNTIPVLPIQSTESSCKRINLNP